MHIIINEETAELLNKNYHFGQKYCEFNNITFSVSSIVPKGQFLRMFRDNEKNNLEQINNNTKKILNTIKLLQNLKKL